MPSIARLRVIAFRYAKTRPWISKHLCRTSGSRRVLVSNCPSFQGPPEHDFPPLGLKPLPRKRPPTTTAVQDQYNSLLALSDCYIYRNHRQCALPALTIRNPLRAYGRRTMWPYVGALLVPVLPPIFQNITALPWPSRSPDLWDDLYGRVRQRKTLYQTLQQLQQVLQDGWERVHRLEIRDSFNVWTGDAEPCYSRLVVTTGADVNESHSVNLIWPLPFATTYLWPSPCGNLCTFMSDLVVQSVFSKSGLKEFFS